MLFSPSQKSPGKLKTDTVILVSPLTPPGPAPAAWALPHFSLVPRPAALIALERPMKSVERLMAGSHGEDVQ